MTLVDFWTMVYEQGVEVVVTLSSETEVGKVGYILDVPQVPSLLSRFNPDLTEKLLIWM